MALAPSNASALAMANSTKGFIHLGAIVDAIGNVSFPNMSMPDVSFPNVTGSEEETEEAEEDPAAAEDQEASDEASEASAMAEDPEVVAAALVTEAAAVANSTENSTVLNGTVVVSDYLNMSTSEKVEILSEDLNMNATEKWMGNNAGGPVNSVVDAAKVQINSMTVYYQSLDDGAEDKVSTGLHIGKLKDVLQVMIVAAKAERTAVHNAALVLKTEVKAPGGNSTVAVATNSVIDTRKQAIAAAKAVYSTAPPGDEKEAAGKAFTELKQ